MLLVGQTSLLHGNVTQLKAIGAKAPAGVEQMVGYHHGRLARGYWICLLVDPLTPDDFEVEGTTMRSGGRTGAPASSAGADAARERVHDAVLKERGQSGYAQLQAAALRAITPRGENRLVKIVPVVGHMQYASPARQYPMGGGSLQWRIKPPGKRFFVAAKVDAQGLAKTMTFSARVDPAAPYDERARLYRYISSAP